MIIFFTVSIRKNFQSAGRFVVVFRSRSISDFDVALAGPAILARARQLGIELRSSGTRTGPLSDTEIDQLGLRALKTRLSNLAGREVNFMIFGDVGAAASRAPSVTL